MQVRKTRWSKVYESSEEELVAFLQARNVTAQRWVAGEFENIPVRTLVSATNIYLAEGSANFAVDGARYSMQPGDTINLETNMTLSVTAGMSGCVCYEAQK